MKPFFHSKERQDALWLEMQTWLGTPFAAHSESKGHGVDCVRLARALYVSAGAVSPRLELPAYSLDQAKHTTDTALLRFLLTHRELRGRFIMVPPAGPKIAGDLLGIKSGRVDHHLAIVNPWGEVVHAVEDAGVIRTPLNDWKLEQRTLYVLRFMEGAR